MSAIDFIRSFVAGVLGGASWHVLALYVRRLMLRAAFKRLQRLATTTRLPDPIQACCIAAHDSTRAVGVEYRCATCGRGWRVDRPGQSTPISEPVAAPTA